MHAPPPMLPLVAPPPPPPPPGGRPLSPSVMFGGARAATPPRAGTPPPAPRVLAEVAVAFAQPGLAERDIAGLRQAELRMEAADRLQEETQVGAPLQAAGVRWAASIWCETALAWGRAGGLRRT